MMKSSFLRVLVFVCLFSSLSAFSQNQTNSQKLKQLPLNHELRESYENLGLQAKTKADNWLNQLSLPDADFNTIELDKEGGVFYVEPVVLEEENSQPDEKPFKGDLKVSASEIFTLHSKPGASRVVYVNFTGYTFSGTAWNDSAGVGTFVARPYDSNGNEGSFSTNEINDMASIWSRISEDYAAFDIDVTTEQPPSFGPNVGHILITNRTDANGNNLYPNSAGGVAYVNVWGYSNYTYYQPALVFYNHLGSSNAHNIADASSHELGHNLSLSHDGRTGESYYSGHGSGNTSWAPIMGSGYTKNVTQWSNGNYTGANNFQEDIVEIGNRLGYRADDHGDDINNATALSLDTGGIVNVTDPETDPFNTDNDNKGVIGSSSDVDMFSFATTGGLTSLTVTPNWRAYNYETYRSSNLDVRIKLYDNSGSLLGTYNFASQTEANLSVSLGAGTYYIGIEGEGSSNYNDYASQGNYYISGNIEGGIGDNVDPVADFTYSEADRTVTFTDASSDSDGTVVSWSWNFGDGATSTDQNPIHTYSSDSDFTVSLTVTDNIGATDSTSQIVTTCLDTDSDGVCDDLDICQGGDDNVDTDGDGTPDFCDSCNDLIDTDGDGVSDCVDQEINSPCPLNVDSNGVSIDSDGDGIADCNDQEVNSPCPNNVDGNGVSIDSDGDGVCDDLDICEGGDDNVDSDGDGIPDFCDTSVCIGDTTSFGQSTLTHSGPGSSNTSATIPVDGQDIAFTISSINSRTGGKPANRFIEEVTVTYVDGLGNNQNYGVFSNQSSVNVSIAGFVQSVTVSLADAYDGNTATNMSIDLSIVDFCVETVPCNDSDGDGVCDVDDQCPGFDDNLDTDGDGISDCLDQEVNSPCPNSVDANGVSLDTDGDGVCDDLDACEGSNDAIDTDGDSIPDGCDICEGFDDSIDSDSDGIPDGCDTSNCVPDTGDFNLNPLTHSGSGFNSSLVNLPANSRDITFTISGIGERTGGKPIRRYIEEVTVSYIDGQGASQNYGVFSGTSSVNVSISGYVQSITASLADGYDGDSSTLLSVDLSAVDFCVESSAASAGAGISGTSPAGISDNSIKLYPNPASGVVNIEINGYDDLSPTASLYNLIGQLVMTRELGDSRSSQIALDDMADGLYLMVIKDKNGSTLQTKRLIIKN
ncbi:MAG: T9SS type A sorting domain-containing protein [Flavobacteriaceae bacterium]|nr:T9SS type A sorting domain-containing protein [Flavobacteriaceae bacterium]